ncbi:hypothetical protein BTVI_98387 [Pitangus sulphuratus]|nr:hypothetical protein BTVI_98387 [Pitangus sulphuratus]
MPPPGSGTDSVSDRLPLGGVVLRLTPHEANGILLGFQLGEVCGDTSGRTQGLLKCACGWIGLKEIKILSVLLAGSLKYVQETSVEETKAWLTYTKSLGGTLSGVWCLLQSLMADRVLHCPISRKPGLWE